MGTINITGTYTDGATASASTIQTDFNAVETFINNKNISVANMSDDSANYCIAFTVASLTEGATEHFVTQVPSNCTLEPKLATLYFHTKSSSSGPHGAGKLEIFKDTSGSTAICTALTEASDATIESQSSFSVTSLAAGTPIMFKVTETTGGSDGAIISEISVALWCRSELTSA